MFPQLSDQNLMRFRQHCHSLRSNCINGRILRIGQTGRKDEFDSAPDFTLRAEQDTTRPVLR